MSRLINADTLADRLDAIAYDDWNQGVNVSWADAFKVFANMVRDERTVNEEFVKHGMWIKMSDADGIYYVCSECGDELPRVIDSFDPQFDLFPKLKCIDKTTYCPNCGAKMENANDT